MTKNRTTLILIKVLLCFVSLFASTAHAMLSMELTQGVASAIPIAVVPFAGGEALPQSVSDIVSADLQNSGRFKVFGKNALQAFPSRAADVSQQTFKSLGTDYVVVGRVVPNGSELRVAFELVDLLKGDTGGSAVVIKREYTVPLGRLRAVSHHISDLVYEYITGVRGVFSTKIAYVVVERHENQARYSLEVADQDGYNPKILLMSKEPIMSPAWSPNGRSLAYVSFEKRRASIYVQDVATGSRQVLSDFAGINGAPAWSPDGRSLALVLSKSGSPNIYVMDIGSGSLRAITNDFYINTEPSWSANGRSLLFTSNRSGKPQIYKVSASGGSAERMSYDGDYNARASYTRDGRHIAMIHRVNGLYKIAMLDLDSGNMRVLSGVRGDSSSPSVAPNGSMVLYDTIHRGRSVLGMVSADGRVQLILPPRRGNAQDPAWSPFLG